MSIATVQAITYCSPNGVPLEMDLYRPTVKLSGLSPAVLYIHGGGWETGNLKLSGIDEAIGQGLLAKGFILASIQYRLAPRYKWPAQLDDAACAVEYLRSNAQALNIDPNRIGAWGPGAGGQIASLLGVAATTSQQGSGVTNSDRVQAVVDMFGPADLTAPGWYPAPDRVARDVFGATSAADTTVLEKASPVSYIKPGDAAFFIIHPAEDRAISLSQSQELADRLQKAGVQAKLLVVRNVQHDWLPAGGTPEPSFESVATQVVNFFSDHLLPNT
jgi:acetyl esterase/lipase